MKFIALVAAFMGSNFLLSKFVSGTLVEVWPSVANWFIYGLNFIIVIGFCYLIFFRSKSNKINEDGQKEPSLLSSIKWSVLLGCLAGAFLSSSETIENIGTSLYIDNGTSTLKTVEYTTKSGDYTSVTVPAGNSQEVEIRNGANSVRYNGETFDMNVYSSEKYIFNIDTANTYLLDNITFGQDYTNKKKSEVHSEVLFSVEADYIFEAPESVMASSDDEGVTKRILYRYKD